MKEFYNKVNEIISRENFPIDACTAISIFKSGVMIHFDNAKIERQMLSEFFNVKNWEINYNTRGQYDYITSDGWIDGISFDIFLENVKIS